MWRQCSNDWDGDGATGGSGVPLGEVTMAGWVLVHQNNRSFRICGISFTLWGLKWISLHQTKNVASGNFVSISQMGHLTKQGGFNGTVLFGTLRDLTDKQGRLSKG